jgi:serine/threonine protein kinase
VKEEFGNNPRLRHHIDENNEENVLVYEFFKTDLFQLVEKYPKLPLSARKAILKEVGLGLRDIHEKNWIHLGACRNLSILRLYPGSLFVPSPDIKPHNIFLNWHVDEKDDFHLGKVVLGDLDCALKLVDDELLNAKIGNVMWRSPEGQLGEGIGKPSDVFSFALLVSRDPIYHLINILLK